MGLAHLEKLLDHFSEEVRQGGRLCNSGIGSNGCSVLVALLAVCADEGIEQQRQPVPGKLPQHLHIPATTHHPLPRQAGMSVSMQGIQQQSKLVFLQPQGAHRPSMVGLPLQQAVQCEDTRRQ